MNHDSKIVSNIRKAYEAAGQFSPDAFSLAFGIFLALELVACNGIKGPDVPLDQAAPAAAAADSNPSSGDPNSTTLPGSAEDKDVLPPVVAEPVVVVPVPEPVTPEPVVPAPEPVVVQPSSCADILKATPTAASGIYQIHLLLPGATEKSALSVYCGMEEDKGGWTLVMSYTHKGGTNPALAVLNNKLPLFGSDTLGSDDSTNAQVWGHASNAMLKALSFTETRFNCRSSANTKVIHFKTSDAACKKAITEGTGSCVGIKTGFTALTKHTGTLPAGVDIADQNKGNATLVDNTFGHIIADGPDVMWNVRGDTNQKSWECDAATDSESANTIHRVWVR